MTQTTSSLPVEEYYAINAIKINQWLPGWDQVQWDPENGKRQPPKFFLLFTIDAYTLMTNSNVHRRSIDRIRAVEEKNIQRERQEERTQEITRFIQNGFPFSVLSATERQDPERATLKKPGWLPTAIVVNFLSGGEKRGSNKVLKQESAAIFDESTGYPIIYLPRIAIAQDELAPIEIIDGQHRLEAFRDLDPEQAKGFQLPVVAFFGLDLGWQAYLFYTINVKPVRINSSLAFDLYPLLRNEDWLEKHDKLLIYRQTRSQEIVDILWAHIKSPWYHYINMLGDRSRKMVSQNAWVNSLIATLVKPNDVPRGRIGGLFGILDSENENGRLLWTQHQQAAYVIYCGNLLLSAIVNLWKSETLSWVKSIHDEIASISLDPKSEELPKRFDPAFHGTYTLLNQDQGIRAFLFAINDMVALSDIRNQLDTWYAAPNISGENGLEIVSELLDSSLPNASFSTYLTDLCNCIAEFDWRSSDSPSLKTEPDKVMLKQTFRGSSGYSLIRKNLMQHLAAHPTFRATANKVLEKLQ